MPCFRSWVWSHLHSTGFSGTSKGRHLPWHCVFRIHLLHCWHPTSKADCHFQQEYWQVWSQTGIQEWLVVEMKSIKNYQCVMMCPSLFETPPIFPPNLGKKSEVSMTCSQVKSLKVHLPFVFPPRPPCLVQSNRGWQLKGSGWRQGVVLRRCENTREHRFWVGRKLNSTWWVMVDVDDEIWWFSNLQISYENITSGHASKSKALHHRLSMDCHGLKFNDWCICNILQFWLVVSGF